MRKSRALPDPVRRHPRPVCRSRLRSTHGCTSAPGKVRRALGAEGGDAFRGVRRAAKFALVGGLRVELLLEGSTPTLVDGLPGARKSAGRGNGQLPCEAVNHACKLGILYAPPDESPGDGL